MKVSIRELQGLLAVIVFFAANTFIVGAASAKDLDWPNLNKAFQGASFVKDAKACLKCHDEKAELFSHTTHAKVFKHGKVPSGGECESCHGPRSKHVENPDKALVFTPAQQNLVCLSCHESGARKHWSSGIHSSKNVSCTSCHTLMEKKSEKALLSAANIDQVCYTCHSNVRAEMNKPSHHPVREGKVSCSGCHEPHGSPTSAMLKG
ncbi:MAG: cytochrome c3 family protein, partial [Bdellovibrionota bacterium]